DNGRYGIDATLLKVTHTPEPLKAGSKITADPLPQLRDVAALTTAGGSTGRNHAEVIHIHRTDTATESKDRLTLRLIETPGQWELGVPGLSELSETTTLGRSKEKLMTYPVNDNQVTGYTVQAEDWNQLAGNSNDANTRLSALESQNLNARLSEAETDITSIESVNSPQNDRLSAVESKNTDQDTWMTTHLDGVSQADASHATINKIGRAHV